MDRRVRIIDVSLTLKEASDTDSKENLDESGRGQ